jgi:hypothetical protein
MSPAPADKLFNTAHFVLGWDVFSYLQSQA